MSETRFTAANTDSTSEQNVCTPPSPAATAPTEIGLEPEATGFDGEFAPCVPPPAPHIHLCRLVSLPDLWWELFYEHPGFMCEFCERLENMEYSSDDDEIVGVFCESCRVKIARLPANSCPGVSPNCLSVRWVGPLGELSDFCRACAHGRTEAPKSQEKSRRRGKRGGRKVRARKERQQAWMASGGAQPEADAEEFETGPVAPGHASRPYGLEIQLGKTPGLRIVEPAPK